jgi:hypothetical protein
MNTNKRDLVKELEIALAEETLAKISGALLCIKSDFLGFCSRFVTFRSIINNR